MRYIGCDNNNNNNTEKEKEKGKLVIYKIKCWILGDISILIGDGSESHENLIHTLPNT